MDSTKTVLIYMKLEADKFESFLCKEKMTIGVNMLFNILYYYPNQKNLQKVPNQKTQ